MYVCMYVCMHVRTYGCMYVRMYACMYVCMHVCTYLCMYVLMYACMYVCMHVCTYVWMHVCTYGCMYVRMDACMYVWMCGGKTGQNTRDSPEASSRPFINTSIRMSGCTMALCHSFTLYWLTTHVLSRTTSLYAGFPASCIHTVDATLWQSVRHGCQPNVHHNYTTRQTCLTRDRHTPPPKT